MPQYAAGVVIDPCVSEPIANGTARAPTAEPDPEDEPPLQASRFVAHAARQLDHGQLGHQHGAGLLQSLDHRCVI
jgi:hypothetical protein